MAPTKTTRTIASNATVRREQATQPTRVIHVQRVVSSQAHKESVARAFRAGRESQVPRE